MGDLTRGTTLPDSAAKSDFHNLIDTATITAEKVTEAMLDCADAPATNETLDYNGTKFVWNAKGANLTGAINFVIDGGGIAITTGVKGFIVVPFACTITAVRLLADQSGSIQVDIWKDTYANYPPDNDDSITDAGTTPVISSAVKSEDTSLTDWTTSVAAGDILGFNVDSCTTITRCTVEIAFTRTA